jgi:hypothetical protein
VHWLQALALATSIVSSAPRSRSAAKSTAYDTDIDDPLVVSGRLTLRADAREEKRRSATKSAGSPIWRGANTTRIVNPVATTAPTYIRAAIGRSFIHPPHTNFGRTRTVAPGGAGRRLIIAELSILRKVR